MVSLAKQAGCHVGTTTNGMCLDPEKCMRLVDSRIDLVAFSLSGTDEKNDAIRRGTNLHRVLTAIQDLNRAKRDRGAGRPVVHIAYMLLRSRTEDVEKLPLLLRDLGVRQVVISTLDFIPASDLEDEAIVPASMAAYDELRSRLDGVAEEAAHDGTTVHYHLSLPSEKRRKDTEGFSDGTSASADRLGFSGRRRLTCTENVQRSFFVSADGSVSPCVFTNLPVSEASSICDGVERPYQSLIFGNINEESPGDIWRKKDYRTFRRSFSAGQVASHCRHCAKLCEG
jgi:MoaA/NifB/PqqE/SkfB family radical SAM enzyme